MKDIEQKPDHKPSKSEQNMAGLGLEEIVHITNKVGLDYVEAKKISDHLTLLKSSTKAKIMLRLDDGQLSEVKLQRLADVDPQYLDFLEQLTDAKKESDRLKVRYESYKNLFEAKRSVLSYQKAEMKMF